MKRGLQQRELVESLIIAQLSERPQTRKDLAESVGRTKAAIWHQIERLRSEKKIHISRWIRGSSQPPFPVFALGNRTDAPRPQPMTKAEAAREFRRRLRKDPARHLDYLMKGKIRDSRRRPPPPADPMFAWIPRREHV